MDLNKPAALTVFRLEERNKLARKIIDGYQQKHGFMDVGIGLVGLLPGAAVPALMAAILLQAPTIYQPMARKLSAVYSASPAELDVYKEKVLEDILPINYVADISGDFGVEFLTDIASELLMEVGFGTAASFIPVIGGFIAAGLDYVIATKLTNRVGLMVSLYFQNGGEWVGSKEDTYREAKNMADDPDKIRFDNEKVRASMIRNLCPSIQMMAEVMDKDQMKAALRKQRVPEDIIEEAIEKCLKK